MTENKRFIIPNYPSDIEDTLTGKKYAMSSYYTHIEIICDLLNELNNQADAVREELRLCEEENTELQKENKQLKKENQFIKHVINEALTAERTELGKSVLKQLKQQIEVR